MCDGVPQVGEVVPVHVPYLYRVRTFLVFWFWAYTRLPTVHVKYRVSCIPCFFWK